MPTCMSDLSGELPAHGRKGRWKGAWAGVAVHAGQAEGSVRFSHRNAALSAGRCVQLGASLRRRTGQPCCC